MTKTFLLFDSDSLKDFHKRIFFSMIVFLFVYFVAIYRIVEIMVFTSNDINISDINQFKERGKILDRNGNLLATSIISKSLSTNPSNITNKKELAEKLSNILNLKEDSILKNLNKNKHFVWLKRNITPREHQQIIDFVPCKLSKHLSPVPLNSQKLLYRFLIFYQLLGSLFSVL